MKDQIELNKKQERILDDLAKTSGFWGSIRAKYAEFGSLTQRQFEIFERDAERIEWQRDAPRVDGVPVRNRYQTDAGKPRCAHRAQPWCQSAATIVVGRWGYCVDHAEEARTELGEWCAARDAERAQERAAEAVGQ
jgi:hypothetical protein